MDFTLCIQGRIPSLPWVSSRGCSPLTFSHLQEMWLHSWTAYTDPFHMATRSLACRAEPCLPLLLWKYSWSPSPVPAVQSQVVTSLTSPAAVPPAQSTMHCAASVGNNSGLYLFFCIVHLYARLIWEIACDYEQRFPSTLLSGLGKIEYTNKINTFVWMTHRETYLG